MKYIEQLYKKFSFEISNKFWNYSSSTTHPRDSRDTKKSKFSTSDVTKIKDKCYIPKSYWKYSKHLTYNGQPHCDKFKNKFAYLTLILPSTNTDEAANVYIKIINTILTNFIITFLLNFALRNVNNFVIKFSLRTKYTYHG